VTYLNVIFGVSQRSDEFWKVLLKDRVRKAFAGTLEPDEDDDVAFDMRSKIKMVVLFDRLLQLLGAQASDAAREKAKAQFSTDSQQKGALPTPFTDSDITKVRIIIF
jgi:hypothetical protein